MGCKMPLKDDKINKNITFTKKIYAWIEDEAEKQGFYSISQFLTMVLNVYKEQRETVAVMKNFTELENSKKVKN
jgi:hypothetical protein